LRQKKRNYYLKYLLVVSLVVVPVGTVDKSANGWKHEKKRIFYGGQGIDIAVEKSNFACGNLKYLSTSISNLLIIRRNKK
jgi:hypothetical protein